MWSDDTAPAGTIPERVKTVPSVPEDDYGLLSEMVAARVHAAEQAERRRAEYHPVRWPMTALRLGIDATLLTAAFMLAYWARYRWQLLRGVPPEYGHFFDEFLLLAAYFVVVALIVFWTRGVYSQPRGASWLDQVGRVTSAGLIAVCVVALTNVGLGTIVPSRLFFIYLWLAVIGLFGVERYIIKQMRLALWRRGINEYRVVVVGATVAGQRVMRQILDRPEIGYRLAGYVDDRTTERLWQVPFPPQNRPRRLGAVRDLEDILLDEHVDELIIALSSTRRVDLPSLLAECNARRINYRMLPDLVELRFDRCETELLDGIPLIGIKEPSLRGGHLVVKRTMDVLLSALALAVLSPIMLAIALAIRLEKPAGPIFFRQLRSGRGGRVFTCYKFRSMRPDAEQLKAQLMAQNEASGPIFKMKNDPRVTRVGRFIRRTSLDELPQLFNIFRGDMSFVGPRPPVPSEVVRYSDWHLRRLEIVPGLTGLWQVSGRSQLTFDEMVTLDIYYMENWSLLLDCKVLLQTLPAVLLARGAY